ncbi:MAG: coproporphyrinogen dehydrogenase HemZ [Clostridia bacterium]|nr:coproporphyrinogen dehydrogenase HemZ [Clostridia bacterium]
MKIISSDNISSYYLQSLCLLYFKGAKFSEDEEITEDTPIVEAYLEEGDDFAIAKVTIKVGNHIESAEAVEKYKPTFSAIKAQKLAVGKAMFVAGEKFFGYAPSWGILTGIRPSKISRQIYNQNGGDPVKTRKTLRDEYFLYPKKAALLTNIAVNEAGIINNIPRDSCSLYISIPFCPTRCAYCSFVSFSTKRLLSMIPQYLLRLLKDLEVVFDCIKENGLRLTTIYIGGGTPTVLNAEQLETLLSFLSKHVDLDSLEEFTLEAGRPDTIDEEKIAISEEYGVTRMSINPQTLNEAVLKGIGRAHTVQQFYDAFELASKSKIKHINTDLIVGLPGDSYRSFARTMDTIVKLDPDNITVHSFCVKRAADLSHALDIYANTGGDAQKAVDYSQLRAKSNGYIPYYLYRQKNSVANLENVGFAKPGSEGRYNIYIMEELQTIFAVGAGAVTKFVDLEHGRIKRVFMDKYPYEYLSSAEEEKFRTEFPQQVRNFYKDY